MLLEKKKYFDSGFGCFAVLLLPLDTYIAAGEK